MKKVDKPQRKSYGVLKLNLSDLTELYSIVNDSKKLCIKTENYEFDTLQEFLDEYQNYSPKEIEIKSIDPYLRVTFNRFGVDLYVSDNDIHSMGIFLKIDKILEKCEKNPKFLYNFIWVNIIWLLLLFSEKIPQLKEFGNLIVSLQLIFLVWIIYVGYIHYKKFFEIIINVTKISFFKRNFDSLIIALTAAIIGAIIGVVSTKTFEHIWPNKTNITQSSQQKEKEIKNSITNQ
jgi:hypothetical protein